MPISVLGHSYEEYKRRRTVMKQSRMTSAEVGSFPPFVVVLAVFACWMEVIIRFMYRFMSEFEIFTLKVPHNTVLLRNCYWDLTYGIITLILAWITDSHVGKLPVIFCGFSIVLIGIYLMALAFSLIGVLGNQSILLTVIYYMGKMLIYTAFPVNPVYIVFVLDQYEITQDVKFIENMCVLIVIARNSKLIHRHFKERSIESMIECFMTYGYLTDNKVRRNRSKLLLWRAAAMSTNSGGFSFRMPSMDDVDVIEYILTHEVIVRTTSLVQLLAFLSPFVGYFFIVKMIYISWITEASALSRWEFMLSSRTVDMTVSFLSVITILVFEFIIIPFFFTKDTNYKMAIIYFSIGHVLIGGALITVSGIEMMIYSQQSFVDVGTLTIHNALNVSSTIDSQFTGSLTVSPGKSHYVSNIDVDDEYGICRGIIYNSRLSWHLGLSFQSLVVKKNDVVIYVIRTDGDLVRVDDFEPEFNFTNKHSMTQLLFINALPDSPDLELLFEGLTLRGKPVSHTIKMPKLTKQKVFFLESGTYQVSSELYKNSFKFHFKPKSYSHVISGDTIMKYDVDLPTRVDAIWDLPPMALYSMSTSIVLIYYLRFIFVHSPPPIRVFCLALLSFDVHIVNAILAVYWTYRKLNLLKKDYLIFGGCYLTNIVLFAGVILSVTLNKPYVGTNVSR
ncbi:uncharacterized protein LOC106668445 [Cimex lectularius]|uniref:Uncharacterized protein n=1 Tax=Cimex lectularius TaxID=79782 RepID=A0A8I6RWJ8_CIMLE|nr:uncharacterized protein LOC106668445 [Cimex lectularius]